MKQKPSLFRLITEATDTPSEQVSAVSLVEITGNRRVLIENHQGITAYEPDCIQIKLKTGSIRVRGQNLTVTKMLPTQIVLCGTLQGVELEGGTGC